MLEAPDGGGDDPAPPPPRRDTVGGAVRLVGGPVLLVDGWERLVEGVDLLVDGMARLVDGADLLVGTPTRLVGGATREGDADVVPPVRLAGVATLRDPEEEPCGAGGLAGRAVVRLLLGDAAGETGLAVLARPPVVSDRDEP